MIEHGFVGDIHGCLDELESVVMHARTRAQRLVFLGDYVNRGPHSRQVVDYLLSLRESQEVECVFLLGNHDQAFLEALDTGDIDTLLHMGGATTIASYVAEPADDVLAQFRQAVPHEHVQFFRDLRPSISNEEVYAAHAPDSQREEREAVGRYRIYGHVVQPNGRPMITGTHAFVDTGCGTTANGHLTCLFWPSLEWIQPARR